eukprot:SAG11_NODE_4047_length_2087_cov_3.087525_2_plen_55_part_00
MLLFSGVYLAIMACDWLLNENMYTMYAFLFGGFFLVLRTLSVSLIKLTSSAWTT